MLRSTSVDIRREIPVMAISRRKKKVHFSIICNVKGKIGRSEKCADNHETKLYSKTPEILSLHKKEAPHHELFAYNAQCTWQSLKYNENHGFLGYITNKLM